MLPDLTLEVAQLVPANGVRVSRRGDRGQQEEAGLKLSCGPGSWETLVWLSWVTLSVNDPW